MCLDAQGSETHGTSHKVLHDALHWLHLLNRGRFRCFLPSEEVTDEDRLFLLVHHLLPLLELLVRAQTSGNLQVGNRVRIPCVEDTVLAVRELSVVGQELIDFSRFECLVVQTDGIPCNVSQSYAADGAHFRAEIPSQQVFAQTDALKNLRAAIRTDG